MTSYSLERLSYSELQLVLHEALRKLGRPTPLPPKALTSGLVDGRVHYIQENRCALQRTHTS